MNRRLLLGMLLAAPVAAIIPAVAKPRYAAGGYVGAGNFGILGSSFSRGSFGAEALALHIPVRGEILISSLKKPPKAEVVAARSMRGRENVHFNGWPQG